MRPVRHAEPGSRRLLPGLGHRGTGSAGCDRGDGQPDPGGRRRGRGNRRRLVPGGRPAAPAISPVTREAARPHTMPVADVAGPRGQLMLDDLAGKRTGERIQVPRERRGLSRPVLAGPVGMSASWLKVIERGTRLPPRLPLLVKLAEALASVMWLSWPAVTPARASRPA